MTPDSIKSSVHAKVVQLASQLGRDASKLSDNDVIPQTGLLDSAAIVNLIVWIEDTFQITIEDDEAILENLGAVSSIARFVNAKQGSGGA